MKKLGTTLVALALALATLVVLAPPSYASNCWDEEGVFVQEYGVYNAHGVSGLTSFHHRDFSNCFHWDPETLSPNAHSAIHMVAPDGKDFVEAGYIQHYDPLAHNNTTYNIFWEANINNVLCIHCLGTGPFLGVCDGTCGDLGLKVEHETLSNGDAGWKFFWKDTDPNATWTQFSPQNNGVFASGFIRGNPQGETSRRGANLQEASDHWTALRYRLGNPGDPWNAWDKAYYASNINWDVMSNYHACTRSNGDPPSRVDSSLASNEYKVRKDGTAC